MKFFKCNKCGNIVELVENGGGQLVCCNQPMERLIAKEEDKGLEKHVPVATFNNNKLTVKVGSLEHPMEEKHYILFITIKYNEHIERKQLNYNDKPECSFEINEDFDELEIYEYCNLHGLWKSSFKK